MSTVALQIIKEKKVFELPELIRRWRAEYPELDIFVGMVRDDLCICANDGNWSELDASNTKW